MAFLACSYNGGTFMDANSGRIDNKIHILHEMACAKYTCMGMHWCRNGAHLCREFLRDCSCSSASFCFETSKALTMMAGFKPSMGSCTQVIKGMRKY